MRGADRCPPGGRDSAGFRRPGGGADGGGGRTGRRGGRPRCADRPDTGGAGPAGTGADRAGRGLGPGITRPGPGAVAAGRRGSGRAAAGRRRGGCAGGRTTGQTGVRGRTSRAGGDGPGAGGSHHWRRFRRRPGAGGGRFGDGPSAGSSSGIGHLDRHLAIEQGLLAFAAMKGFRDFLLRGNLVELAVAFIMGVVFAAVVEAFTKIVLDILGLIVRVEGLSGTTVIGINIGSFLTALITFLLTALVLYFAVVVPYNRLSALRKKDEPAKAASTEDLLAEIRDLLRERNAQL